MVVKRFRYPYSVGDKYLAKISTRKKLMPLLKKEKNEKIIPFLIILLLKYFEIISKNLFQLHYKGPRYSLLNEQFYH